MNFIDKWEPDDLIAVICIICLVFLIAIGYDSALMTTFISINGVYVLEKRIRRAKKEK